MDLKFKKRLLTAFAFAALFIAAAFWFGGHSGGLSADGFSCEKRAEQSDAQPAEPKSGDHANAQTAAVSQAAQGAKTEDDFSYLKNGDSWGAYKIADSSLKRLEEGGVMRAFLLEAPDTVKNRYSVTVEEYFDSESDIKSKRTEEYVSTHVIAAPQDGVSKTEFVKAAAALGLTLKSEIGENIFLFVTQSATLTSAREGVAAALKNLKCDYAELDYISHARAVPNDAQYSKQWAPAAVSAPAAWDELTSAADVTVAVIDTGIRYTHEDLSANMWVNASEIAGNSIDDDGNGYVDDIYGINPVYGTSDPNDDHGHGTHCAGIIGAVGNNSKGVCGAAWKVKLMALKFTQPDGTGSATGTLSDAIICITYAINKGADIISFSNSFTGSYSSSLYNSINSARQSGIVFVAAAGNDGTNNDSVAVYPASYSLNNIVAVGSTTSADEISDFSNYGLASVDIFAPGSSIYSTYKTSNSSYVSMSGTSMATPLVAGALALVKEKYPDASYAQLIDKIYYGADALDSLYGLSRTGARLNIAGALAASSVPVFITQPQSATSASGAALTLYAAASTDYGTNFSWQYSTNGGTSWLSISGARNAYYTLNSVSTAYNGYLFRAALVYGDSTYYSDSALLTVSGAVPKILTQPASASAYSGDSASFYIWAAGVGISYAWQYSSDGSVWQELSGAAADSLTVNPVTLSMGGLYYRCVVGNSVGSVASSAAVLSVSLESGRAITYDDWAYASGLSGDYAAMSASPTGDGLTNLEKYALGIGGGVSATLNASGYFASGLASGDAYFTYPVYKLAEGVSVTPLWSADLVNWSAEGLTLTESEDGEYYLRTASKTLDSDRIFFRLQIEKE